MNSTMPTVFIPAQLRSLTGGVLQVEVEGRTVREAVAALDAIYPGVKARLCGIRSGASFLA